MDIASHGLWGGVAFGRKNKRLFWWSFFLGIFPDLFSFGIFTLSIILGFSNGVDWSAGPPPLSAIPDYVHMLYNITHSFIIFAIIFSLVWFLVKKPFWPLAAWGLHIGMDIFTHSANFFATPFLWPLSDFKVDSINWTHSIIFIPNLILLFVAYVWFFHTKRKVPGPRN